MQMPVNIHIKTNRSTSLKKELKRERERVHRKQLPEK